MLVYVSTKFKNKRKKPRNPVAKKLNRKQLEKIGCASNLPVYKTGNREIGSLRTVGAFVPARSSMTDPMALVNEPEHVKAEILAKAKRIAIPYNKGAYQYICGETESKTIGRKNPI
jgi:hypothetical protein